MSTPIEKQSDIDQPILLKEYINQIAPTDTLSRDNLRPLLYGIFGEVGGVMTAVKKAARETTAYTAYLDEVEEELGDLLWYFSALCSRLNIDMIALFESAIKSTDYEKTLSASGYPEKPIAVLSSHKKLPHLDDLLIKLGEAASGLFVIYSDKRKARSVLLIFAKLYLQTVQTADVCFAKVVRKNINKTRGRFVKPVIESLPTFDGHFSKDEQIPKIFEITINQRDSGRSYLKWNDVFIGDPLTDNIKDPDGYRFHDVFHFAHAAILHWSPVFRALIKQKRKSDPLVDEAQDGGRAVVVEEGLTAWVFSRAKKLDLYQGHSKISFDTLKSIQQFVHGYEVDACPLNLWEQAILQGYAVFREVKKNNGGIIVGNRENRTLVYKPIKP